MKPTPEFTSKFKILKKGRVALALSSMLLGSTISFAAPSGGVVSSGSASIEHSGKVTNINQVSDKASINWQKFGIKSDETVNFKQPDINSITLNRVVGNERSVIDGALNANGQVWILNSNGVLFGKNAKINTAGLLATTKELSDEDFNAGEYSFKGDSTASVINMGTIDISDSGYAVLLADSVSNEGEIKAIKGTVHLTGAKEATINLNGNSLVDLVVDKGVLDALVENKGAIYADGGEIYLTTNAADELLKGVVNNEGIIEANSIDGLTGHVELFAHGGEAKIGGSITALEGFVETSGKEFTFNDAKIEAGEWLIDPVNVTINDSLATAIEGQLANGDATITTDGGGSTPSTTSGESGSDGNIYVNSEITWNTAQKLTLNAYKDIYINKAITASHANGQVALYYGQGAANAGNDADYHIKAPINLKAGDNFFTKLGNNGAETTWTVVTTATALQSIALGGNSVLGANVDASGIANWTPIGGSFTGNFDGLGHTVDSLTISRSTLDNVGLFGELAGGSIQNIGVTKVNISGNKYVGGLVGLMRVAGSTIKNSYVTGSVSGKTQVGGLVGNINSGTISNSYSTATINGSEGYLGGLVGYSLGKITNSYATGDVNGDTTNSVMVGGLVGFLKGNSGGSITNSYATGKVIGASSVGGLVGFKNGETITDSFYDKTKNQSGMSDSPYGKTKAEIIQEFAGVEGWSTDSGGGTVAGYEVVELPYLTDVTRDEDKSNMILFSGGYGTEAKPYSITNWTQLQNINNSNILTQNHYFSLLNDLSSSTNDYVNLASSTANSGGGWNPLGDTNRFLGNFDGLGHVIDRLTIDRTGSGYQGLFGYTDTGSVVKNIGLTNVDIKAGYSSGAIAGANKGTISNSYATGTLSGVSNIGGLIGMNTGGTISNSYSTATVNSSGDNLGGLVGTNSGTITNSYATGSVTGEQRAGGLVGHNNRGTISLSYATGSVTGDDQVGGLVGVNEVDTIKDSYATGSVTGDDKVGGLVGINVFGTIERSYAASTVTGSSNKGGLVGYNMGNEIQSSSFFDKDVAPGMSDEVGYGKTTAELQTLSTFGDAGWDIQGDSSLSSDYKYPVLSSFNGGGSTAWKIYTEPTPTPDPTPDPTPTPYPTTGGGSSTGGDSTPTPSPTVEKEVETERENVDQVVITIVNQEATRPPKIEAPSATQALSINDIGSNTNVNIEANGANTLISQPIEGQGTKRVSMSEAKAMQIESGGGDGEVRVPLSRDSMIELVDGGVNLPEGVEQEFYVADGE